MVDSETPPSNLFHGLILNEIGAKLFHEIEILKMYF